MDINAIVFIQLLQAIQEIIIMKEHSSNHKKTFSRANANQPSFQMKSEKEPFFKPEKSENSFSNKSTSFFLPSLNNSSPPIQRKKDESIPEELQAKMEDSFGQDFTNVNIQKNSQEAVDLNARAFTKGDSIHFAPGEFSPNSEKGRNLIGHEFAHVTQQRSGVVKPTKVMRKGFNIIDDKELESEADNFGKKAVSGESIPKYQSSSLGAKDTLRTIQTNKNMVQLSEHTEEDHTSSVPHLMRILDEGDTNSIRAALVALQSAERLRSDTEETVQVAFTSPQGDTYNLTITSNEIDEFIRMYERYLIGQGQTDQATNVSDEFVTQFNGHFSGILHIFGPEQDSISDSETTPEETSGTGDQVASVQETSPNQGLSAREIARHFTQGQINLLSQYLDGLPHIIPERLFNGDETNLLDAHQRIVMSAHILANGEYDSEFRTQRVHARMCGHWVELVHHYAGASPRSGGDRSFHEGTMGTTDPTGQIVLGGGSADYSRSGARLDAPRRTDARRQRLQAARATRDTEQVTFNGAEAEVQTAREARDRAREAIRQLQAQHQQRIQITPPGERQALWRRHSEVMSDARQRSREANQEFSGANRRLQAARGALARANREHRRLENMIERGFFRREAIPISDLRNLQRGDWLYIYNDNDSRSGDHSVIFSRWLDNWQELDETHIYRRAELFSQGRPESGGRSHQEWIGNFSRTVEGRRVKAVTWLRRSSLGSNPADAANEMLPTVSSGAATANIRFLNDHNLEESSVMQRLEDQNRSLLDSLAWRLTRNQRAILLSINREDNLERRVQLNERLRNLSTNVSVSEAARARSVEAARSRYEPRIARRREAARRLLQGLTSRFSRVDKTLQSFAEAIAGRPNGVVPNSSASRLPTTLDADTFAQEIGFTVAADAVVDLNRLLQRETVTPEQAEEESRQIDQLRRLFSVLSANIPPPNARRHLRNLRRSTQQNKNNINPPATLSDFRRWRDACVDAHGPLDQAIRQLQNSGLIPFARSMRQQGGTLPFVTTHIGGRGERFSPTGLLSNVPDILSE